MQHILDFVSSIFGDHVQSNLSGEFVKRARKFYNPPESYWEPVRLRTGKTYYLLKEDTYRQEVIERMVYLEKECTKLWARLLADPLNVQRRASEVRKLRACLAPQDTLRTISRIVQKPLGGYDVRAYAHDSWIFIELPTFKSVETGDDGVNTTEEKRRKTLMHILVHELAHVAGYWEHDDKHSNCISWLTKYTDP